MKNYIFQALTIVMLLTFSSMHPLDTLAQGQISRPTKNKSKETTGTHKKHSNAQNRGRVSGSSQQIHKVSEPDGYVNGHGYVDLGLPSGTKWATCNVGATSPEGYGSYFAWGDTEPKSDYSPSNCRTQHVGDYRYRSETNKITNSEKSLNKSYDAASANWGESWRMPTGVELMELKEKCFWTWTSYGGIKGYFGIGPNGKSIFLPAAGSYTGTTLYGAGNNGIYWSSTFINDRYTLSFFFRDTLDQEFQGGRFNGHSVRPIVDF